MAEARQCLELLKGPSDEKRFVGLLLVVKMLSSENDSLAREIWKAIGNKFLMRLLLPLARDDGPELAAEVSEVKLMGGSVATAVLSAFCKFDELARSQDTLDFLPILVQVWRNRRQVKKLGGDLGKRIQPTILKDILHILESLSRASEDGLHLVIQKGGVHLALTTMAELKEVKCTLALQSMQLLSLLLMDSRDHQNPELSEIVCQAVENMAELLNIAPTHTDCSDCDEQPPDPAALQLEALHVLLMILGDPIEHVWIRYSTIPDLQRCLNQVGRLWDANIRSGLCLVLQSKSTPIQRHSAILLAARMIDLQGPHWLVSSNLLDPEIEQDSKLLRVLAEIVKIEISILLHDALSCAQGELAIGPEISQAVSTALKIIPACFQVIEALIDILAESEDAHLESFSHPAGRSVGLDDTTSLRMMETVSDCVAYILSFVEETTDYSRHFSKNTLLVACSRCVGRFLAEVPEGHSEAVIKCLKPLCMSGEVSEGAGFLVPGLLQLVRGEDSIRWVAACSEGPVMQSFLARASFLADPASGASQSSSVGYSHGELGAVCHLISAILSEASIIAADGVDPDVINLLSVWLLTIPEGLDASAPSLEIVLDVGLLVCLLAQLYLKSRSGLPLAQKGCSACMKVVEIGCRGRLGKPNLDKNCAKKWGELLEVLCCIAQSNEDICLALIPTSQTTCVLSGLDFEQEIVKNENLQLLLRVLANDNRS